MEEEIRKYEYEFSSIEDIKKYISKYESEKHRLPEGKNRNLLLGQTGKYDFYKCKFLSSVKKEGIEFLGEVAEKGDILFRDCKFEIAITFNIHPFKNSICFYNCEFQEIGDFGGAVFTEQANFNNCKFLKKGDFWNCKFEKKADFSNCKFQENANFKECEFKGKAGFNKAIFTEQANFNDTTFTEQANFNNCKFLKKAYFEEVTFTEKANFNWAIFTEQASFWGTTFTEKADFNNCKFLKKAYFEEVTFTENADFRLATFTEKTNFKECEFKGKADFINTTIKKTSFEQTIFRKQIDLSYRSPEREKQKIEKLEFRESTFEDNFYLYSREIETFILLNNRFEKVFSFSDSEIKNTDRETARVLKDVLIKQNNRIEALQYHKKEMKAHYRELRKKWKEEWRKEWGGAIKIWRFIRNIVSLSTDISVLFLNKYSNNHGHSWFGGVLFFLITTKIVFFLYLYSLDENLYSTTYFKYYFEFIIPTHNFDFIPKNLSCTKNLGGGAYALDTLGRIVSSFGIYQTIQAFRKFGKI